MTLWPRRVTQPTPKRRRRGWLTLGVATWGALPFVAWRVADYGRNLAVLNVSLPPAPGFSSRDRLMVVSPHLDDETLGVGGTLAQARASGAQVRVVFLTNGDGSRSTQIAQALHQPSILWQRDAFLHIARMRQREAISACARLGIARRDVVFLGYPDGGALALWQGNWSAQKPYVSPYTGASRVPYDNARTPQAVYCGQSALRDVMGALRDWKPTHVFTTHPSDTHPDHATDYAFTACALEVLKQDSSQAWAKQARLMTFLVHHGPWPTPSGYRPGDRLAPPSLLLHANTRWLDKPLTPAARESKRRALEAYPSQLVFTPRYLRSFVRRNEVLGQTRGGQSGRMTQPHAFLDPSRDALETTLWSAADVRRVEVESVGRNVRLSVRLGAPPSSDVRLRFALHTVSGGQVRASQMEVLADERFSSGWRVSFASLDGLPLAPGVVGAERLPDGLRISMPRAVLGLQEKSAAGSAAALLFSLSTHAGPLRLDQMETVVVSLP